MWNTGFIYIVRKTRNDIVPLLCDHFNEDSSGVFFYVCVVIIAILTFAVIF